MTTQDTGAAAGGPFSIQPRQLRLQDLRGLGKARVQALHQAGIHTVADLLMDIPVAYQDTSRTMNICNLKAGETVCVAGTLEQLRLRYNGKLSVVQGFLRDDTGGLGLVWFNQPWMAKQLRRGDTLVLYGRVERYKDSLSLQNPARVMERGILPVYRPIDNVPAKTRAACVRDVLPYVEDICPETLPDGLRERHGRWSLRKALHTAHAPGSGSSCLKPSAALPLKALLYTRRSFGCCVGAQPRHPLAAPPGFARLSGRLSVPTNVSTTKGAEHHCRRYGQRQADAQAVAGRCGVGQNGGCAGGGCSGCLQWLSERFDGAHRNPGTPAFGKRPALSGATGHWLRPAAGRHAQR